MGTRICTILPGRFVASAVAAAMLPSCGIGTEGNGAAAIDGAVFESSGGNASSGGASDDGYDATADGTRDSGASEGAFGSGGDVSTDVLAVDALGVGDSPGGPCTNDCADAAVGTDCVNGSCGCASGPACSHSGNGTICLDGGTCGCQHGGDCSRSPNGNQCLATGICGCNNNGNCSGGRTCCLTAAGCFGGSGEFTPYQHCAPM